MSIAERRTLFVLFAPGGNYVPSSCRSFVAYICFFAALLLTPAAHAAHWAVTYSCSGSSTGNDYRTNMPFNVPWTSGTSPNTGYSYWTSGQSSGTITPILTWTLDANETVLPPSPAYTVAQIKSSAQAYISVQGMGTDMIAKASDSLDGAGTASTTLNSSYSNCSCQVSGTHYVLVSNPTAQTSITMTAVSGSASSSATGYNPGGYGGVGVSVVPTPITINPGGTTPDASGNRYLLTGQQCSASPSLPSGFTPTSYAWSVVTTASPPAAADVFKTYDPNLTSNQLVPLSGSDLTAAAFNFYDKKQETIVVKCNINLTAPDGTPLSIIAQSPPIAVEKPVVTFWGITEGYVQYNPNDGGGYQAYGLYGDLSASSTNTNGMIWSGVTASVPAPFSGGQCTFTQIVTPNRIRYIGNNGTSTVPNNGILGLDGSFQYGSPWNVAATGNDVDSPTDRIGATGLTPTNTNGYTELSDNDAFTTYVMYQPTGGIWVPLQKFSWAWGQTLTWQNSRWNLTASNPATLGSAPTYTTVPTSDPPQWTVIH